MSMTCIYFKRLALCCCLLASACGLSAQGEGSPSQGSSLSPNLSSSPRLLPDDSLRLHFRISSARVDSSYGDNLHSLRQLERLLADSALAVHLDALHIRAYTSPDGSPHYNYRLARQRSEASRNYLLRKYPYLDPLRIRIAAQTGSWKELLTAVEGDPQVPSRKRVMEILSSNASAATKQANLRLLAGGAAYRYLTRRYLPQWRYATIGMAWMSGYDRLALLKEKEAAMTVAGFTDTVMPDMEHAQQPASPAVLAPSFARSLAEAQERSESSPATSAQTTASAQAPLYETVPSVETFEQQHPYIYKVKRPLLALKTNLLFDAALMPNIEVEVPLGKRWSLNGELMFPWWLFEGDKYCLQILMGGLEGRYWLGSRSNRENREVLTGHFLGLYAGGGKYDLQWDRDGYQGEFFIAAGISYGYAHKIARNLRLEYNIGIGLLRTDYEHYHTLDNYQTLLWQNNGRYTWLGPTKLKVSLVWLLNRKVKVRKGGAR